MGRNQPTFPISVPERPSSRLRVVNDQNLSINLPTKEQAFSLIFRLKKASDPSIIQCAFGKIR